MKNTCLRQAYLGTIGDMKNLEQHFADMAQKGWMIDKIGLYTHRYRAVEPCKKRFFVDLLPQISAFDYPENENARDYRSICEESGWTFLAANKQFHVFCADGENDPPIPIHTDNRIHAKIYLKACRKYELPWFFYALFMLWFFSPLGKGPALFLSNIYLFMTVGYFFFSAGYLWTFGFVIRWYIRTARSAKHDLPMPPVSRYFAEIRGRVFLAGLIALVSCMILGCALELSGGMPALFLLIAFLPYAGIAVGFWIRRQIDTKQRSRAGNIRLTAVSLAILAIAVFGGSAYAISRLPSALHSDSLENRPALTLPDIGLRAFGPDRQANTRIEGTPAVPLNYSHWESGGEGSVSTQVYRSVSGALSRSLYIHFSEEFTRQFSRRSPSDTVRALSAGEAAFWGAQKGFTLDYTNRNAVELLLLNDKTVLRLSAGAAHMDSDALNRAVKRLWGDIEEQRAG